MNYTEKINLGHHPCPISIIFHQNYWHLPFRSENQRSKMLHFQQWYGGVANTDFCAPFQNLREKGIQKPGRRILVFKLRSYVVKLHIYL